MTKKNNSWDFNKQLAIGTRGETEFQEVYWPSIDKHPDNDGDFIEKNSGKKIELKTDTYDIDITPNFFIERYSNYEKKTPGSVWQAISHDCQVFCYLFIQNKRYFKFRDLDLLRERIELYVKDKNLGFVFIRNKGWVTAGYKIPRNILEDLYEEWNY